MLCAHIKKDSSHGIRGGVKIEAPHTACIQIGFHMIGISDYKYQRTIWQNSGIIQTASGMGIGSGISAASSTLYELCAMQTPTITYIFADNQVLVAKGFE